MTNAIINERAAPPKTDLILICFTLVKNFMEIDFLETATILLQ
jgi:hypothetical protein